MTEGWNEGHEQIKGEVEALAVLCTGSDTANDTKAECIHSPREGHFLSRRKILVLHRWKMGREAKRRGFTHGKKREMGRGTVLKQKISPAFIDGRIARLLGVYCCFGQYFISSPHAPCRCLPPFLVAICLLSSPSLCA